MPIGAPTSSTIQTAEITIGSDATPRSTQYDDIYFSADDGLAEARTVFLGGNDLPTKWQDKARFVIAETGFGTGLNFLATWQAWRDDHKRPKKLFYVSVEKHPINPTQLAKALAHWPELEDLSSQLIKQLPPAVAGIHPRSFNQGDVQLLLVYDDINTALKSLLIRADVWFLDGFAPSRNPDMWTPKVFAAIARLSKPNASLATFTAAGQVRRDLITAGFKMQKRPGFGQKRERLVGQFSDQLVHQAEPQIPPWFALPKPYQKPGTAAVVGAGIAGAQIARHLADSGWQVDVYEQATEPATGASGNRAGVLSPKVTTKPSLSERFSINAFLYQVNQLQCLRSATAEIDFDLCGYTQLAWNKREEDRSEGLANRFPDDLLLCLNDDEISDLTGETQYNNATHFPQAGWVSPRSLVHSLLDHPKIQLLCNTTISAIQPRNDQGWSLNQSGDLPSQTSDIVVLANGHWLKHFLPSLPVVPARGQSSEAQIKPGTLPQNCVLDHNGYAIAHPSGNLIYGASFTNNDSNAELRDDDELFNQRRLRQHLPHWFKHISNSKPSHAGVRATTPDRWPVVGAVVDDSHFCTHYSALAKGQHYHDYNDAPYQRGLYVLGGLGSRGLTTAAYCARLLTALINDEPITSDARCYLAMHPARFLLKTLKQGTLQ